MSILTCPRCLATMEPGFVLDRSHYGQPGEQQWVGGVPVKSFWTGLKTRGRMAYSVMTYRCERCGYLESYARTAVKI